MAAGVRMRLLSPEDCQEAARRTGSVGWRWKFAGVVHAAFVVAAVTACPCDAGRAFACCSNSCVISSGIVHARTVSRPRCSPHGGQPVLGQRVEEGLLVVDVGAQVLTVGAELPERDLLQAGQVRVVRRDLVGDLRRAGWEVGLLDVAEDGGCRRREVNPRGEQRGQVRR